MGGNMRKYEREEYRRDLGKSSAIFHVDKTALHNYLLFS
jgi:hypothetical protein